MSNDSFPDYMDESCIQSDEASEAADALPTTTASPIADPAFLPTPNDGPDHEQLEAEDIHILNKQADMSPYHVPSTTLEGLPPELRIRLLASMPDLETLGRLVHASPVYHAQYRLDRKPLLSQILLKELGEDGFLDAYAAFKSRPSKIGPRRGPNKNVTDFLASYRQWRSPAGSMPTPDLFSAHDLSWMAWFYKSTVNPLAARFVAWAHANLDSVPATIMAQSSEATGRLSTTETIRLRRALYRFEIFCRLFGDRQYEIFMDLEVADIFFSNMDFEPWEVEEMCCVYEYVKETYEETINDVRWDLDEKNPKFAGMFEPQLEGLAFPLEEHKEYLSGTIGHGGLRLVLKMLKAEDHDQRVELMTKSLRYGYDFFDDAMFFGYQRHKRHVMDRINKRNIAEQRREIMPFAGDGPSTPPITWVLLWGGKYSSLFGGYVPPELRRWGHVMWDKDRLDVDGARKYVAELWTSSPVLKLAVDHFGWMSDVQKDFEQLTMHKEE